MYLTYDIVKREFDQFQYYNLFMKVIATVAKQSEIARKCIIAFKNPSDISKDKENYKLQITNCLALFTTFNESLIFSQLFKVPLDRYTTPTFSRFLEIKKA